MLVADTMQVCYVLHNGRLVHLEAQIVCASHDDHKLDGSVLQHA